VDHLKELKKQLQNSNDNAEKAAQHGRIKKLCRQHQDTLVVSALRGEMKRAAVSCARAVSVLGSCGLLLCCMALSASEVYHLTVDKLRQVCSERGLDSSGPVRLLRQRLADHVKGNPMDTSSGEGVTQASVPTDLVQNVVNPNSGSCSHGGGRNSPTPVLAELFGQVSPLCSEDQEAILRFFLFG